MRRLVAVTGTAVVVLILLVALGSRILPSEAPHSQAAALRMETTSPSQDTLAMAQGVDMADECAKYMSRMPGMPKITADQMREMMKGMMGSMMPGGNMMPPRTP
jgi:hypothetical protein